MIYRSPLPDVVIPEVPLHEFLFARAKEWPNQPALIDGPTGRTVSYRQLCTAVRRVAGGLAARGFAKGDVFAIYSPNLPEYAAAFYGAVAAGGIVTTVNPLYTARELTNQLTDAGARFLVTVAPCLDTAQAAASDTQVEEIFVFGDAGPQATPFASLMAADASSPPALTWDPRNDLAVLPYSSGTTGLSKGVMLTHYNLVANLVQTDAVERLTQESVVIGILPFYHIYGMTVIMGAALRAGATIVTMPRFEIEQFLELIQKYRVTNAYLVPPIVLALAKHPAVERYDLSSVDSVMSGAAPLPESVAAACAARNGVIVRQGYGLTEASPVTHTNSTAMPIKATSVGPSLPNTEYRIVDLATGQATVTGEPGEVWIRGPQIMKGYWRQPAATRTMIDADGWLHTGDIGHVDEDGYLYVVDRVKELIKYKGWQVAPAELEAIIQAHPAVADVAVVPSPDAEAGEVPKAFVVVKPRAEVTAQALMDYVAERVSPQKKIRRVAFIDAIPKVPSGKILRRQLIEQERAGAVGGVALKP